MGPSSGGTPGPKYVRRRPRAIAAPPPTITKRMLCHARPRSLHTDGLDDALTDSVARRSGRFHRASRRTCPRGRASQIGTSALYAGVTTMRPLRPSICSCISRERSSLGLSW
jgi:hypothetical protein